MAARHCGTLRHSISDSVFFISTRSLGRPQLQPFSISLSADKVEKKANVATTTSMYELSETLKIGPEVVCVKLDKILEIRRTIAIGVKFFSVRGLGICPPE